MSVLLEKEYKIYLNHLNEFVRHHHNEFVLIKDGQVVDFFSSYEEALQTGLKRFGNVAFFIKEVRKKQERHFLHQSIQSL